MNNDHSKNVINYFLDVLNFNDYILLPDEDNEYVELYDSEVKSGCINKEYWKNKHNDMPYQHFTRNKNNSESDDRKEINIILMTKLLDNVITDRSCKGESRPVCFFYIRAKLTADNKLMMPDNKDNAICRSSQFIYPNDVEGCSLKINEAFSEDKSYVDWTDYISYIKSSFSDYYGIKWNSKSIRDVKGMEERMFHQSVSGREWVMIKDDFVDANSGIVNLLYTMRNNYTAPLLFDNIIYGRYSKEYRKVEIGTNVKRHVGQMKSTYPMADNQRTALHAFQDIKDGNVLAVSGPPGTGKTTMLQSVVADYIVRCAIEKKTAPVILISSSNNKAITNVIDSFNIREDEKHPVFNRWVRYNNKQLPLAVYMASSSAKAKLKAQASPEDMPFFSNGKCGEDYDALKQNIHEIEQEFKKSVHTIGCFSSDIKEIKYYIFRELKNVVNEINRIGEKPKKGVIGCLSRAFGKIFSDSNKKVADILYSKALEYTSEGDNLEKVLYSLKQENSIKAIDKLLDPSLRFNAFWLAVHYYEACWIEEVIKNKDARREHDELLHELALVCPCTVATFYKAPTIYMNQGNSPLYSFADLLIVDEAGQVCPEIGLPTFAFAKKAIVMGDVKQIPPVYSIYSIKLDRNLKDKHGIDNKTILSASDSCIMKIAAYASQINDSDTSITELIGGGFMLNEHYRCYDEIIAYCNKLMYDGKLIPKKGKKSDKKNPKVDSLPAMAVYTVKCDKSKQTKTGSRINEDEADAIVNWIEININQLKDIYKQKKLEDIVCIITPFKAQSELIEKKLKGSGNKEIASIKSGTVHTFQGAECPIVCFSTTYGASENFGFLHKQEVGKPILNVAVSRAKEHFLLFTSKSKQSIANENINKSGLRGNKVDLLMDPEDILIAMCEEIS